MTKNGTKRRLARLREKRRIERLRKQVRKLELEKRHILTRQILDLEEDAHVNATERQALSDEAQFSFTALEELRRILVTVIAQRNPKPASEPQPRLEDYIK